jgi:predicted site-specific integrase-resolvase
MNERFVSTATAKKTLGVGEDTLRRWANQGIFPCIKTPKGTRLYNIDKFIKDQVPTEDTIIGKENICYCRVSSQGQKDDLERQIQFMHEKFPTYKIVSDIGSGINFKRKGLRSIIELATKGGIGEVVVAHRDRLCRFAFELVEWFLQIHQVKLVVLSQEVDSSKEKEMVEDLLAIINVFNCRVNGRRKYKRAETKDQQDPKKCKTSGKQVTPGGVEANT